MSEFGSNNPSSKRINETEMQQMFLNLAFISNNGNYNDIFSEIFEAAKRLHWIIVSNISVNMTVFRWP